MSFDKTIALVLGIFVLLAAFVLVGIAFSGGTDQVGASPPPASESVSVTPPPEESTGLEPPQSPEPSPEPDLSVTAEISNEVRQLVADMTLREKVCQMFVAFPDDVPSFESYPVGGLVYSSPDLYGGGDAVRARIAAAQAASKITLLISADEEGGDITRLSKTLGTTAFQNMFSYRFGGAETAFSNAATIARDMKSFSFNTDFAPVADVWSNPENTVIGERAYSDSFTDAAILVSGAVRGFKSEGLIATVKHFPGHGDTAQDSHYEAAVVTKSLGELRENELLPFKSGIRAGVDMVMIGHMTISAVSDKPATVSYEVITELLRNEMGFCGVIITDGLEMAAVTSLYSDGELCKEAVKAGVDMLLGIGNLTQAAEALLASVENGEISEERIDESVMRILEMKRRNGLI